MPIPDILFPFLLAWCVGKKNDDYVFTKVDGTHMAETKVRRWWESFHNQCHRAAGVKTYRNKLLIETSPFDKDLSPHYLRHTHSTDIHAAGVHEREQLYFMGHKSQKVTDRYRAVSDDSFARAAEQINQYFNVKYAILRSALEN